MAEATAQSGLCSGKITKVVKEVLHYQTGAKVETWSVFVRPKSFSTEKAAREWSRATAGMANEARHDKKYGQSYLTLAR
jgi:hypothetical protein